MHDRARSCTIVQLTAWAVHDRAAKIGQHVLDQHRDQGLVFDDQNLQGRKCSHVSGLQRAQGQRHLADESGGIIGQLDPAG